MRAVDGPCGHRVRGTDDDDLFAKVQAHVREEHPELGLDDDAVRRLVDEQAYDADLPP